MEMEEIGGFCGTEGPHCAYLSLFVIDNSSRSCCESSLGSEVFVCFANLWSFMRSFSGQIQGRVRTHVTEDLIILKHADNGRLVAAVKLSSPAANVFHALP
ncbi:hypothetical protein MPTK2_8g90380P [Marchantia polymorpha subsp. ruderalis]